MEGGRHGKVKYHHYFGAEVPFLRMEAADDQSPSSQATVAALIQAENHWKKKFDVVAQLMANCPLRTATDIQGAGKTYCSQRVFMLMGTHIMYYLGFRHWILMMPTILTWLKQHICYAMKLNSNCVLPQKSKYNIDFSNVFSV